MARNIYNKSLVTNYKKLKKIKLIIQKTLKKRKLKFKALIFKKLKKIKLIIQKTLKKRKLKFKA